VPMWLESGSEGAPTRWPSGPLGPPGDPADDPLETLEGGLA
jgi:hypothetical protein